MSQHTPGWRWSHYRDGNTLPHPVGTHSEAQVQVLAETFPDIIYFDTQEGDS